MIPLDYRDTWDGPHDCNDARDGYKHAGKKERERKEEGWIICKGPIKRIRFCFETEKETSRSLQESWQTKGQVMLCYESAPDSDQAQQEDGRDGFQRPPPIYLGLGFCGLQSCPSTTIRSSLILPLSSFRGGWRVSSDFEYCHVFHLHVPHREAFSTALLFWNSLWWVPMKWGSSTGRGLQFLQRLTEPQMISFCLLLTSFTFLTTLFSAWSSTYHTKYLAGFSDSHVWRKIHCHLRCSLFLTHFCPAVLCLDLTCQGSRFFLFCSFTHNFCFGKYVFLLPVTCLNLLICHAERPLPSLQQFLGRKHTSHLSFQYHALSYSLGCFQLTFWQVSSSLCSYFWSWAQAGCGFLTWNVHSEYIWRIRQAYWNILSCAGKRANLS